jgi:nucleoside-diphosphate-sugar epimerase
MDRLLITGAGGFLGSALAEHLGAVNRWTVVGQRRLGDYAFDLTDQEALTHALLDLRPTVIVHAAGRTDGDIYALARDNVLVTASLLEAVTQATPSAHVICLGSAAEYGPPIDQRPVEEHQACMPTSAYGILKKAASEMALRQAKNRGLRILVLRLFNVVGVEMPPTQVLGSFLKKMTEVRSSAGNSHVVQMGSLDAERDFITTHDLARFIMAAVDRGVHGRVLNACSGKGYVVRDLVEYLRLAIDPEIKVQTVRNDISPGFARFVGSTVASQSQLGVTAGDDLFPVLASAAERVKRAPVSAAIQSR